MSDPTSPDRVPLDRPPVPRFNPLPDLPDLPEMPRGSAPTPSVPIPAPPLPAPRVVVDLPRPSPSVTIDAPPRPAPRATIPTPKSVEPTPPAATPAPQGRWVGEAIATLLRPTKSKATVVAAAGSLVAGAFVLQLLVGHGLPTTPPTGPSVVAKATEKAAALDEHSDAKPVAADADEASSPKGKPLFASDAGAERFGEWPDSTPFSRPLEAPPGLVKIKPAAFPLPDANITLAGGQSPPGPVVPTLPDVPAVPATPLPMLPTPAAPVTLPTPVPTPPPAPIPAAPEPVKPVVLPFEVPKAAPLPALPAKLPEPALKAIEGARPFETPQPATPEPVKPTLPPKPAFVDVTPNAPAPAPIAPAPAPPLPSAFVPVEPPPEPRRIPPTPLAPAVGEARTDYDVDLHPPQAGQTYEAVSKQHYGDAKYADALRAYNKNHDPGRDELQIPPTHALRKLATAGRPLAMNPIAPAGGETWAPPAALGNARLAAGRTYTVTQDGTTFRDLAGTLLNDRAKYRRISDLNPSIDPNAKLQKGDRVTVP